MNDSPHTPEEARLDGRALEAHIWSEAKRLERTFAIDNIYAVADSYWHEENFASTLRLARIRASVRQHKQAVKRSRDGVWSVRDTAARIEVTA